MVVPFGSAPERRSRTTYRPTVTTEGSTHVDTAFTGTTSSIYRTAAGKVAVVAVVRQRVSRRRLKGDCTNLTAPQGLTVEQAMDLEEERQMWSLRLPATAEGFRAAARRSR